MQFRVPEDSPLGGGYVQGFGMLGQAASSKLRASAGKSKLAAKVAKKLKEKHYRTRSGATSGLNLNFSLYTWACD